MTTYRYFGRLLIAIVLSLFSTVVIADEEEATEEKSDTLTIGSKAPALDVEHWFSLGQDRFEEVTDFKKDKVYVIEFWATWCGPCISSMPHLVEIQNRHAEDGVQIVSISREPKATVEKFLKRKVRGRQPEPEGDSDEEKAPENYAELTSAYCLTCDPDQSSHTAYMTAAAQGGIPCSFIVGKTGLVEWIGHPMSMDRPLQEILDDKWDRTSFAEEFKKEQEFDLMMQEVSKLARRNDFDPALELLEAAKKDSKGRSLQMAEVYFNRVYQMKLRHLTQEDRASEALEDLDSRLADANEKDKPFYEKQRVALLLDLERNHEACVALKELIPEMQAFELNEVAWSICQRLEKADKEKIDGEVLETATKAAKAATEKAPTQPAVMDTLAHLVYLAGDTEKALEIQKKAVELDKRGIPQIKSFLRKLEAELGEDNDAAEDDQEEEEEADEETSDN